MNESQETSAISNQPSSRESIKEAYNDLVEYNKTKRAVADLLLAKRKLQLMGNQDPDKINEIKSKALEAINHLFNDIIAPKKN